jgi:hypothetical protein
MNTNWYTTEKLAVERQQALLAEAAYAWLLATLPREHQRGCGTPRGT